MDQCNQGRAARMQMSQRIVAAVFARGGSKGVPRKALREVAGRSLLERAIDQALSCERIEAVFVSTDDEEYASRAVAAGALVPFLRPSHLAGDCASEIDAWRHLIEHLATIGNVPGTLVSVPPTAPLRAVEDIEVAIELFDERGADLVVSASESHHNPSFNMMILDDNGWARLVTDPDRAIVRRQDAPTVWNLTTVVYVARVDYVLSTPSLFAGRVALSTVPVERALDVDSEFDLLIADLVLKARES